MKHWKAKIQKLRSLKDDWDNKGSRKPTEGAICVSECFLSTIEESETVRVLKIDPGAMGGVDVQIFGPLSYVKVILEIEDTGDATAVFVDGDIDVKRIKPGPTGHKRFLKDLEQFLSTGEQP